MAADQSAAFERYNKPSGATLLKFRCLLNDTKLSEPLLAKVGEFLKRRGFRLKTGTIVGAATGRLSSTKNADNARDPETNQTRKGQQWYFDLKLQIGVDSESGLAHSPVLKQATVLDKHPLPVRLPGNERHI